jgi:hypothetical protein
VGLLFLRTLDTVVDALPQLAYPICPFLVVLVSYKPADGFLERSHCLGLYVEGLGDFFFFVVVVEGEGAEVESSGGSEGHADLIAEESVGDVGGRVLVDEDHDDAADHLPDLVVDEALSNDVEDQIILAVLFHPKT